MTLAAHSSAPRPGWPADPSAVRRSTASRDGAPARASRRRRSPPRGWGSATRRVPGDRSLRRIARSSVASVPYQLVKWSMTSRSRSIRSSRSVSTRRPSTSAMPACGSTAAAVRQDFAGRPMAREISRRPRARPSLGRSCTSRRSSRTARPRPGARGPTICALGIRSSRPPRMAAGVRPWWSMRMSLRVGRELRERRVDVGQKRVDSFGRRLGLVRGDGGDGLMRADEHEAAPRHRRQHPPQRSRRGRGDVARGPIEQQVHRAQHRRRAVDAERAHDDRQPAAHGEQRRRASIVYVRPVSSSRTLRPGHAIAGRHRLECGDVVGQLRAGLLRRQRDRPRQSIGMPCLVVVPDGAAGEAGRRRRQETAAWSRPPIRAAPSAGAAPARRRRSGVGRSGRRRRSRP